MFSHSTVISLVALSVGATVPAIAQTGRDGPRVAIELRGGANVPTFDITDAAKPGPSFGGGLDVALGSRFHVLADADFGLHKGAALTTGGNGPDVNVYHFIGKVGYDLLPYAASPWSLSVNAGAGAVTFAIDRGSTYTYPAINVGAKIGYRLTDRFGLVLSPQGDIAFSKKAELGTTNAWVWPFAAGFRIRL